MYVYTPVTRPYRKKRLHGVVQEKTVTRRRTGKKASTVEPKKKEVDTAVYTGKMLTRP